MPRSQTPVVSSRLAMPSPGPTAFRYHQNVGFHRLVAGISSRTTKMTIFGAQSRGLHTRYTWLRTHLYRICTQVRYRFGGSPPLVGIARLAVLTHWVTSTNFTESLPDSKVLNLTRHDAFSACLREILSSSLRSSSSKLTGYFGLLISSPYTDANFFSLRLLDREEFV